MKKKNNSKKPSNTKPDINDKLIQVSKSGSVPLVHPSGYVNIVNKYNTNVKYSQFNQFNTDPKFSLMSKIQASLSKS